MQRAKKGSSKTDGFLKPALLETNLHVFIFSRGFYGAFFVLTVTGTRLPTIHIHIHIHVTCYMLHVTCYMLHVTCYMLHVTCYMLHVTCYIYIDIDIDIHIYIYIYI